MNTRVVGVAIDIIDNGQYEEEEQFFVRLSSSDSGVMLNPFQTIVGILDDDGTIDRDTNNCQFHLLKLKFSFFSLVHSCCLCLSSTNVHIYGKC